jgi:phosphoribosylformylglycinamidine synthase
MIVKVRVMTRPKANTLDPQGVVVKKNLERIGVKYLKKVSIGRYIEIETEDADDEEIKENIQSAIDKLLYNSIIEDYEVIYEQKNAK